MNDFWFGSVHITCSHSGQCAGLLWDTLGYPWVSAFLLWGQQSSVKTVQSSHLLILSGWTPILTTTMLRKPWKTTIYIYLYLCFAINYDVYPGNLLETWETIGNPNWFCSDRPEVEQPNTHLAHRLPSVVRGDPGILICLRLHLVGPRCGYDMFLVICNCHWWVRLWEPGGRFMRFMIEYAPMSHYFTGNTTTMGVTIGFVHMLELSHGGTVWRWPGDQMWRMGPNPKSIGP